MNPKFYGNYGETIYRRKPVLNKVSDTVVYFETVEDFPPEEMNEGRRPSICNKNVYREGTQTLIGGLNISCGTDAMIILERLLRGIVEMPDNPYFWVKDWLALGYDRCTKVAYEKLRFELLSLKFRSDDNPSLFEQFEMPSFEELAQAVVHWNRAA